MKRRLHVFYSGMVQGVGFRYTAEDIALGMGIAGWVRNLRDGKVEILAEAEEKILKNFLSKLNGEMGRCIRETDVDWSEPTGEFSGFEIRFD